MRIGRATTVRLAGLAGIACSLWLVACAPKALPPVAPGAPHYPDYVYPEPPGDVGDAGVRARHAAAWTYLQGGDVATARREYVDILKQAPAFYPADAALGYAALADRKPRDAAAQFARALQRAPRYVPALVGRGEALLEGGDPDQALTAFESALAVAPGMEGLARRVEVLKFGRVNELVAEAARAAEAGRFDEARRGYERALAASPDSAFLARDLGLVELRAGAFEDAVRHLDRAVAGDADDARAWAGLAEAHERRKDVLAAIGALERLMALEPTDRTRSALTRLREQTELARLPDEYRAIPSAPQARRADLAALLGVRLLPHLPGRAKEGPAVVVTDTRAHWASAWILAVTRAGLMEVYANHTFQPRTALRRVDLAYVVSRALNVFGVPRPKGARGGVADVPADHLSFAAVAAAVDAGIMTLDDARRFRPAQPVTGAEAVDVVTRLEALARRRSSAGWR